MDARERAEEGDLRRKRSCSILWCDHQEMSVRLGNHQWTFTRQWFCSFLCVLLSVSAGCGYQFRAQGPGPTIGGTTAEASSVPPPRVVIRTLRTATFEPNLETRYTNYLRHEFASGSGAAGGPLKRQAADLVVSGDILSVVLPTLSLTQTTTLAKPGPSRRRRESSQEARTKRLVWSHLAKGCIGILCDDGSAV